MPQSKFLERGHFSKAARAGRRRRIAPGGAQLVDNLVETHGGATELHIPDLSELKMSLFMISVLETQILST